MFLAGPNHGGNNKENNMARKRSTLRLGARFNGMSRSVRRAAPTAFKKLRRAGAARTPSQIRGILKSWGVKY